MTTEPPKPNETGPQKPPTGKGITLDAKELLRLATERNQRAIERANRSLTVKEVLLG